MLESKDWISVCIVSKCELHKCELSMIEWGKTAITLIDIQVEEGDETAPLNSLTIVKVSPVETGTLYESQKRQFVIGVCQITPNFGKLQHGWSSLLRQVILPTLSTCSAISCISQNLHVESSSFTNLTVCQTLQNCPFPVFVSVTALSLNLFSLINLSQSFSVMMYSSAPCSRFFYCSCFRKWFSCSDTGLVPVIILLVL